MNMNFEEMPPRNAPIASNGIFERRVVCVGRESMFGLGCTVVASANRLTEAVASAILFVADLYRYNEVLDHEWLDINLHSNLSQARSLEGSCRELL
jgi:hypothetical protein